VSVCCSGQWKIAAGKEVKPGGPQLDRDEEKGVGDLRGTSQRVVTVNVKFRDSFRVSSPREKVQNLAGMCLFQGKYYVGHTEVTGRNVGRKNPSRQKITGLSSMPLKVLVFEKHNKPASRN